MNVSLRWLEALAPDLSGTPDELSERLASLGFPVEGVHVLSGGIDGLVVARVLEVSPHPNADRLRICRVDGSDGEVQVVCGASNVEAGAWYPFAPVGATLPGGMQIRKARLRGEESVGMLCSERELGLGRDHEGLMTLSGTFTPGQPLLEALGLNDVRLEVEVTSNRPDLLSHRGVARELSPGGDAALRLPEVPGEAPEMAVRVEALEFESSSGEASADGVTLRVEAPDLCSRYLGMVVRGIAVGPSPLWLQNRLRAAGARPINNVVDATNYILLELGQPLHAFDLDRIANRTVVVRRAGEGEGIRTLDGVERKLSPSMLAICDADRPIAVAGVMGGEESEVTEATRDLFLECALFAPGPTRSTRKALGLSTDASYRFERGVDPEGMRVALLRAARLILATAGGEPGEAILDVHPTSFERAEVVLRPARITKVLGVPFSPARITELLTPLGFEIHGAEGAGGAAAGEEGSLLVRVPGFRSYDVTREVDLIEEVARRHGFDNFPEELGAFRPGTVPDDLLFRMEDRVRDHLVALGFFEAQTPAFAPAAEGEVELQNPVSAEEGFLRTTLLPSLLRRVEHNLARGNRDVRLFELGTAFRKGGAGERPIEAPHLALVFHGARHPSHWSGEAPRFDVWDVKGILTGLAGVLGYPDGKVQPEEVGAESPLEPGGSLSLSTGSGVRVGAGGQIRPGRLDLPPWAGPVWGIEITLPTDPSEPDPVHYRLIPAHPAIERDLALLVPEAVSFDQVEAVLLAKGGPHFRGSRVFDLYRGKGIAEGMRSVAVRLHFRAPDRTLQDGDVEPAVRTIIRTLEEELSVGTRGSQS